MILSSYTVANGAILPVHKLARVVISGNTALAIINSYKDAYDTTIAWQDGYDIPITEIGDVETWLVSPSGPFSGGSITSDDLDPLETAKALKSALINKARNDVQWSGVETLYGTVDSDPESQRLLNGAVLMAQIAIANEQPFSIGWTMKNNVTVTLDGTQLILIGIAVGTHIAETHAIAVGLKAQIAAATTVEEVEAISWPSSEE